MPDWWKVPEPPRRIFMRNFWKRIIAEVYHTKRIPYREPDEYRRHDYHYTHADEDGMVWFYLPEGSVAEKHAWCPAQRLYAHKQWCVKGERYEIEHVGWKAAEWDLAQPDFQRGMLEQFDNPWRWRPPAECLKPAILVRPKP